jgi:hypothetical protein
MNRIAIAALVAVAASQAPAQTPPAPAAGAPVATAHVGLNDKLINNPVAPWNVYGPNQTSVVLDKGGPQGYPATRVTVSAKGANAWDTGVGVPLPKAVAAGDVIYVAIYLRAPEIKDGATAAMPFIGVGGPAPTYATIATDHAAITNQWAQYYAVGTATAAFAAGSTQVTVHLAGDKHVIDVGPVRVFDLGPNFDTSRLPRNK